MKTPNGTLRTTAFLLSVLLISAGLAACGGGGGGSSTSTGTLGPATVRVSIASATGFPAGTTFAPSPATLAPATAAPPGNSPEFTNVFVTVTKLSLIPSTGDEFPDENGELEKENSFAGEGKIVTGTLDPPIRIDLLNLTSDNAAMLLNQFSGVPAGEYSKIRVYYEDVIGQPGDKLFHPTAHYHFDVHFVGGNLLIPVTSDPQGGVGFYSVVIKLVGLKYHQAGQSGNILLRPQVFATVEDSPEYIVTGFADNVAKDNFDGLFDILALGGRSIPAAFSDGGTTWAYSDNVLEGSSWVIGREKGIAVPAFHNGAIVSAIGVFDTDGRLHASHITFSFPVVREGFADNVWIPPDNTAFVLHSGADNLVISPRPDRDSAYYDNAVLDPIDNTHHPLDQAAIDNDVRVKARGYGVFDILDNLVGIEAYWISIGGVAGP